MAQLPGCQACQGLDRKQKHIVIVIIVQAEPVYNNDVTMTIHDVVAKMILPNHLG